MTASDFDQVVIRSDRGKTLVGFAAMSAATAFILASLVRLNAQVDGGVLRLLEGPVLIAAAVIGGLSVLLIVAVIGGHVANLVSPPRLVLTPEGLKVSGPLGRVAVPWGDVEAFAVGYDHRRRRQFVGLRFRSGAAPRGSPASDGLDQTIGFGWPGRPEDLARQLEDWRIRYGSTDAVSETGNGVVTVA